MIPALYGGKAPATPAAFHPGYAEVRYASDGYPSALAEELGDVARLRRCLAAEHLLRTLWRFSCR